MNTNMIINYDQVLKNIYDEATDSEKNQIDTYFSMNNKGIINDHQKATMKKIIKKYRPQFFQ